MFNIYQIRLVPSYIQDKHDIEATDVFEFDEHRDESGFIQIRLYSRFIHDSHIYKCILSLIVYINNNMEYVTKELDMKSLQEEILRKCRKKTESLILPDETENDKEHKEDLFEEDIVSIETEKTTNDELLFEDVLAEKRRKYTTKQEFIYLLYNNILPAFVAEYILYDIIQLKTIINSLHY